MLIYCSLSLSLSLSLPPPPSHHTSAPCPISPSCLATHENPQSYIFPIDNTVAHRSSFAHAPTRLDSPGESCILFIPSEFTHSGTGCGGEGNLKSKLASGDFCQVELHLTSWALSGFILKYKARWKWLATFYFSSLFREIFLRLYNKRRSECPDERCQFYG